MDMISTRLIVALNQMGLSHHDAKVYASLVYFNSVGAKDLIDFIQISKPSVYESLQRLQDRGLVIKKSTKPAIFTPVSPRVAIDILIRENSKASEIALKELELLSKSRRNIEDNDAIWTVYGEKSVEHKIREMFTAARDHILCVMGDKYLPFLSALPITTPITMYLISNNPETVHQAEEMLKGTKASVTLLPMEKMISLGFHSGKKPVDLKYFNLINSFEIIIDDRETLSIPPLEMDKTTGLYSVNEVIVFISKERMQSIIGQVLSENQNKTDSHEATCDN
jgi:sugar-specific transcriptional regulator TrmB